jgi:predicted MPP superfamily phosphohydrolase
MISRRRFIARSLATAAGAIGLYTWRVEPHWVELVRRPMRMPGLPPGLRGATVLHVSDLHVGPRVDPDYLIAAFDAARAAVAPDLVVVTGDFVTWRDGIDAPTLARVLAHLPRGRLATLASLGNHDYGLSWRQLEVADAVTRVASDAGIRVLRNAVHDVAGLQVAGLGDLWSPEARLTGATLQRLDRTRPALVLGHNPDALDVPMWEGVRGWVLAGHTHGGQCKPPFLPPPLLPVRNRRYTAGVFDVGPERRLYVNRGLGHLIRARFNARPEVTVFTLS